MSETPPTVVGPVPWLPGAVGRVLFASMPAERLAAFRIGVAVIVLIDVIAMYLPDVRHLLGPGGTISAAAAAGPLDGGKWSVLRWLPAAGGGYGVLAAFGLGGAALLAGWRPRTAALVCWVCATSLQSADPMVHNGGDRLRSFVLFALAFCPAGAVWSVRPAAGPRPVLVSGWPARLMLVQLACLYFASGWVKLQSPAWHDGTALLRYFDNLNWCAIPGWAALVPVPVVRAASWLTLAWELTFPVLVVLPRVRLYALALGAVFHLGTAVALEVGLFPWYALCCYLPLLPWERLGGAAHRGD